MSNYFFFLPLFFVFSCTTSSDSDWNDAVDKTHGIYVIQCGKMNCESVRYDTKKIPSHLAFSKKGKPKLSPGDLLLQSFSGKPYQQIEKSTKSIAAVSVTLKTPIVAEEVLLSMALAAGREGKKPLFFYLLDRLVTAKNKQIRSAAYNAYGVGLFQEDRVMEAVSLWKKSLEEEPDNWPARLNLAIVSLQYHRFSFVAGIEKIETHEWMASLLSALEKSETGKISESESLCQDLLEKKSHVLVRYNCGVLFSKGESTKRMAKKLLMTIKENEQIPNEKRKTASDILSKL